MHSTTSYAARSSSKWNKVLVWILLLFIVLVILFLGRAQIMRIVAKNPTAFQLAMKGQEMFGNVGLKLPGHSDTPKKSAAIVLPDEAVIIIDLAQSKGNYHQFWGGFGYNSFKAGSVNPDNQKLFQLMVETNKKNPGTFNYIRTFNIFTNGEAVTHDGEGCEIYSEDEQGHPRFNWAVCDRVFDYIVSLDFELIIDFTLMPIELASNKTRIQPWFGGNMSPPLSHEKWSNLVYETTRHFVERYGIEKVTRWYFEVWNEPDLAWLFWIPDKDHPNPRLRDWGDMEAYNKLYDYTVTAVKKVSPNLRVGGPVVAGSFIEPLLEHLDEKNYCTREKGTPIDFLSFHSYGSVFEKVINKIDEIHRTAGKIKKEHQKLPLIVSEFSPSPYDAPWYVTRYPALWLIATVDAVFNYADQNQRADFLPMLMVYWTGPVINDFGQDPVKKSTDGLATTLGNNLLKLPIFNAFEMLGYLSNERVTVTSSIQFPDYRQNLNNEFSNLLHAIATRSDSSFEVIVYQFTENDPFSKNQKQYRVRLEIENIPDQKFYLSQYVINEHQGDVYPVWKSLNSPMIPNQNQWEILDSHDDLKLVTPAYEPEIVAGKYNEEFTLHTNQANLLIFAKQKDEMAPFPPGQIVKKEIGTNSVYLEWQPPQSAPDGDLAAGYGIYQNQKLVCRTFNNRFASQELMDDMNYEYQIYSLDDQGNMNRKPLTITIKTNQDNIPPELVSIDIHNLTAFDLRFSEPLDTTIATHIQNYRLNKGVFIKSISMNKDAKIIQVMATPHSMGEVYNLTIQKLRDRARRPNEILNYSIDYNFLLNYKDDFDVDDLNGYFWTHIWQEGGIGNYQYDATGKRLKVTTGDDIGERFSHSLPETDRGTFQIDFQPIKNYPTGGRFLLRLKQTDETYYQLEKTHGFGPGYLKKVVGGLTVDSTSYQSEFQQGSNYTVMVNFSPDQAMISAFLETVTIDGNNDPIKVKEFEIELLQQDAYFDNIYYESK